MLTTKMDQVMKKLDNCANNKILSYDIAQAMDSHMTCEVCGNVRHSRNYCPEIHEEACYTNNTDGYRPQKGLGWNQPCPRYQGGNNSSSSNFQNQPSLKDRVFG